MKSKPDSLATSSSSNNVIREESKGNEYEVISTNTSIDSVDPSQTHHELDLFTKESCIVKNRLYEALSRHMILNLHL
jgi:hypothetical protein